jgi:putative transport protein
MDWLVNLFTTTDSVAHIAILYAVVIAIGVLLGKIKFFGISLGVTFVLFAGIIAGHIGFTGPTNILTFVQDFGLILFVFMIGMQVGPGFFESFRKGGITLNLLAVAAIILNIVVMFACYFIFFDTNNPYNLPMMVGTLYGAVTNTPGLGAANEALASVFTSGELPQIASGYACAYPLGVVGIIYESRPNVTCDAAVLCLKSGNACILRGGKEAINSNIALMASIRKALTSFGLSPYCVTVIEDTTRESSKALMTAKRCFS